MAQKHLQHSGRRYFRLCLWAILQLSAFLAPQAQAFDTLVRRPASGEVTSYAVTPDSGFVGSSVNALRSALARGGIRQMILPGDNLYNTKLGYDKVWGPWRKEGFEFPVVAIGNHNAGHAKEVRYFSMPGEYYSKVIGSTRFIVLNSNNTSTARQQADFLRDELERANEDFIFVVYHHPPYTISPHHRASEKQKFHDAIRPILQEHSNRIDALLVGHDHIAGVFSLGKLPMIVTGAAVQSLKPPKPFSRSESGVTVKSEWLYKDIQTWTRLDINEKTGEAWAHFTEVKTGKVTCSALLTAHPVRLAPNCAN